MLSSSTSLRWLRRPLVAVGLIAILLAAAPSASATNWQELYPQSAVGNATSAVSCLALSDNDQYVYTTWNQWSGVRAVLQHDATTGAVLNTYATPSSGTYQPKAVATDDRGNVFIGYAENGSGQIEIRNGTLSTQVAAPFNGSNTNDVDGLSVVKDGSTYYLYVSRASGVIQRFDVTTPSTPAVDSTFGTSGTYTVTGAGKLRGIEVDDDGTIYVAQRDTSGTDRAGHVYVILSDLSGFSNVGVTGAMDVALDDTYAYITEYNGADSTIQRLLKSDLSDAGTITPDILRGIHEWEGPEDDYGYTGIDLSAIGRFYLGDEWWQITRPNTNQAPLYFDRVLVYPAFEPQEPGQIPEPGTLALLGMACAALARRRRRSR